MTENSLHVSQRNKRTLEDKKKKGSLRKEENNLWKRMKSVYTPIKYGLQKVVRCCFCTAHS